MSADLTIRQARLVLPDRVVTGDLVVADGVIEQIGPSLGRSSGEEIDGSGLVCLPGVIDTLAGAPLGGDDDDGAALARVTGAAAAAGVTSMLLEDPDTPARDARGLHDQLEHAGRHSRVHYGVYLRADPDHPDAGAEVERTPGLRWVWGARGDEEPVPVERVDALFAHGRRPVVLEGQDVAAMAQREALYADARDPAEHSRIYTPELAAKVTERALELARKHGRRLHLPRVGSDAELERLRGASPELVTAQACVPQLFLRAEAAYDRLGSRAVDDPPVRISEEVDALWRALGVGRLLGVASGHGTVRAAAKDTAYPHTPPGLPTADVLLPLLFDRFHRGEVSLLQVARWTADAPARAFGLGRTGRLEVGYDADLVLVDPTADLHVGPPFRSWSDWSPFDGFALRGRPVLTVLRGRPVFRDGRLVDGVRGRELVFGHTTS